MPSHGVEPRWGPMTVRYGERCPLVAGDVITGAKGGNQVDGESGRFGADGVDGQMTKHQTHFLFPTAKFHVAIIVTMATKVISLKGSMCVIVQHTFM